MSEKTRVIIIMVLAITAALYLAVAFVNGTWFINEMSRESRLLTSIFWFLSNAVSIGIIELKYYYNE